MPRHESLFTHDRANGMSDYANTGAASRCVDAGGILGLIFL